MDKPALPEPVSLGYDIEYMTVIKGFTKGQVIAHGDAMAAWGAAQACLTKGASAGSIAAGPDRYVVTEIHRHPSLCVGDHVYMTETPSTELILLRASDKTLHGLMDQYGQYVHLAPAHQGD